MSYWHLIPHSDDVGETVVGEAGAFLPSALGVCLSQDASVLQIFGKTELSLVTGLGKIKDRSKPKPVCMSRNAW